ncbi:hypothetical protein ABZS71_17695 [Streptomyces sp. NPDC005393]|uniref:hypothetical protein n=1 Tax=Streptomyces sp. NPDC005393 TaxID=3157041 RepID=UPI0033BD65E9
MALAALLAVAGCQPGDTAGHGEDGHGEDGHGEGRQVRCAYAVRFAQVAIT